MIDYTPFERKLLATVAVIVCVVVAAGSALLVWKCFNADFSHKVEYRNSR